MALDEPKENDRIFSEQGITLAIDKDLLEKFQPIGIDFLEAGGQSGFILTPNDQLPFLTALQDLN